MRFLKCDPATRWRGAALCLGLLTLASGCASSGMGAFANFRKDKAVEMAAADASFPSAAEVGLASNDR